MYDILGRVLITYNKWEGSDQYSGEVNDQRTVDETIYTDCRKHLGKSEQNGKELQIFE